MTFTLSLDDIKTYLSMGEKNPALIAADLTHLPEYGLWERLPKDHPKTLIYPKDGKSVSNHRIATISHYSYDKSDRRWPDDDSVIRIGCFLGLSPVRIILLVLKTQCENSFYNLISSPRKNNGLQVDIDQSIVKLLMGETNNNKSPYHDFAQRGFRPGMGKRGTLAEIFHLLVKYQANGDYGLDIFNSLAVEILKDGLFLYDPHGPEISAFLSKCDSLMNTRNGAYQASHQLLKRLNYRFQEYEAECDLAEKDRRDFESVKSQLLVINRREVYDTDSEIELIEYFGLTKIKGALISGHRCLLRLLANQNLIENIKLDVEAIYAKEDFMSELQEMPLPEGGSLREISEKLESQINLAEANIHQLADDLKKLISLKEQDVVKQDQLITANKPIEYAITILQSEVSSLSTQLSNLLDVILISKPQVDPTVSQSKLTDQKY